MDEAKQVDQKNADWLKMYELEERLREEREERSRLAMEIQKLRQQTEALEEQKEHETGSPVGQRRGIHSDHTLLAFVTPPVLGSCRCFYHDKKQRGTSGNGGSPVQGAGLVSAGQAGLCHQGLTIGSGPIEH